MSPGSASKSARSWSAERPELGREATVQDAKRERDLVAAVAPVEQAVERELQLLEMFDGEVEARGDAAQHEVSHAVVVAASAAS